MASSTRPEADFDEVVKVAAAICEAPISVVNLIDAGRQWFKAEVGLGVRETPIESSICAHAILQPGLFEVPDTTLDNRFCDDALVSLVIHICDLRGRLIDNPGRPSLGYCLRAGLQAPETRREATGIPATDG